MATKSKQKAKFYRSIEEFKKANFPSSYQEELKKDREEQKNSYGAKLASNILKEVEKKLNE